MSEDLEGKVALITGTAGGQGAVAAELFAAAGATVVGCDLAPTGGEAQVDLTDEDAVRRWVDAAAEEWHFVLRHELDVVFFPVTHVWPHLRRAGGSVVLVGSTAGLTGSVTNPRVAHTVTKGGVVALTKQLAAEGAAYVTGANLVIDGGWSAVLPR